MSFGESLDELVQNSRNGLVAAHPSWARVRLGEVAKLVNGYPFKSTGFNADKGTPVVRIRDISRGCPETLFTGDLSEPKIPFIENGQIVIGMDGDFNCRIWQGGRALLNQRVCTVDTHEEFFSQKLLAFALPGYLKLINDNTSSVTVKHLSSKTVQDIPLPLPPLPEQRRIVEKIETLFARLDKGEEAVRQVQTLLKRYRQSVLKAAVTGDLTADWREANRDRMEHGRDLLARILKTRRETWVGRGRYKEPVAPDTSGQPELPEGWVWSTIDQATSTFGNGLSKKPVSEPNEFPILRISATRAMKVSPDDRRYYVPSKTEDLSSYWVRRGDFLFTRYNGSGHLVGVCGRYRDDEPVLHPDKLIKVRSVAMAELDGDFLELAWNAGVTRRHIERNTKTTSGQKGVAGSDIKAAPFPLPSASEQAEIAMRVSEALEQTSDLETWCETELARSTALRQSILKQAFSGRLVPQDPSDEPASDLLARIRATGQKKKNGKTPA